MAPNPAERELAALRATVDDHEPDEFVALMHKAVEGLDPANGGVRARIDLGLDRPSGSGGRCTARRLPPASARTSDGRP